MNKVTLDKPKHKIFLGTKFTIYWDKKKNVLALETRDPHQEGGPYYIEIPIKHVYKFIPVKWEKGETFKEVSKKKPKLKKMI